MILIGLCYVYLSLLQPIASENNVPRTSRLKRASTSIRLVNGTSNAEGRLEVYHNGTWGTVCDDAFTDNAADVVCRMLSLGNRGIQFQSAHFGKGTLPILLDDVRCKGIESSLDECSHTTWGQNNCGHAEDVGVKCYNTEKLRLVGGQGPWEGRLEVFMGNEWGTVCSSGFDNVDAQITCKSLNYSLSDASLVDVHRFGQGTGSIVMKDIQCSGNEKDILLCPFHGSSTGCTHGDDVAVKCEHTPIKLADGGSNSEGRVEIQHNGVWGTICDSGFGQEEAEVICRMLGYGKGQAQAFLNGKYGQGTGPSLMQNMQCTGFEKDISACRGSAFGDYSCGHSNDAGVNCTHTPIRLVNGSTPYEGRVEVMHNGRWGTICDNDFDTHEATVICSMLGFTDRNPTAYPSAHFGQGNGSIHLDDLRCDGNEKDIALCPSGSWGKHNCDHTKDASVVCSHSWNLRLSGNNLPWKGRLEISKDSYSYGTVCIEGFSKYAADSVCQYQGYDSSKRIWKYAGSSIKIWSLDQYCSLNGSRKFNCSITEAPLYCNPESNVGVECERTPIRLVDGSHPWEGRVEVIYDNHWGTVCRNGLDQMDASIICGMLGFKKESPTIYSYTRFGQGTGPVWVKNLDCYGNENDIALCKSDSWTPGSCSHSYDVSIACGHTSARFVNGSMPFEGRVEIYHSGQWLPLFNSLGSYGALTVCTMMGYNRTDIVAKRYNKETFGYIDGTSSWNVQYNCDIKDMDIAGCTRNYNKYPTWYTTTTKNEQGASCYLNARLTNGPSRMAGRLELFRNNKWGTVCDINFTNIHATAICRMLAGANQAKHVTGQVLRSRFFGKGTGPVWKFQNGCGSDGDIVRCLTPESTHSDCGHDNDVSIICKSSMQLRLTGGTTYSEGTIELQYNGTWGALCDYGFYPADAISACKQLGFWVNSATYHTSSYYGQTTLPKWHLYPQCKNNDFDISMCLAGNPYIQQSSCSTAGTECQATALGRNNIRLINGNGTWTGMVEVKLNNNWGGICWTDWDNNNTDIVCRMLRYRGSGYSSSAVEKKDSPLFIKSLNCTGSEDDIGLCKATTDIESCSNKAVAVDCSGGLEVRLVGGNNAFEGRVEIKKDGTWGTLCDSSWDVNDARVICSMMGFSHTSPTVYSNAHFGQGSGSVKYADLGCSGWEDHIGQCNSNTGGSCSHSDDAGVRCFSCVQEFNTETGTFSSPNYPSNYGANTDCVYVIKPTRKSVVYRLAFGDYYLGYRDTVEIQESSGRHLATFNHNCKPNHMILGEDFIVRFKSDSSTYRGFQASWKPLTVQDTITAGCGSSSWKTAVNMTLLRYIYPDSKPDFIFMNTPSCKGVLVDDLVVFDEKYSQCGSKQQKTLGGMTYTNTIMYPEASGGSFPIIIRHFRWKMDLECNLHRTDSGNHTFKPDELTSTTPLPNSGHHIDENSHGQVSGTGHHAVDIHFYKDRGYFEELTEKPLILHIGEDVYVKVTTDTTNEKMRLHTCTTKPYSSSSMEYPLIKDGCIVDQTTHILSQTNTETKFVFTAFEFPTYQSSVYITCNATFCGQYENSAECNQRCHQKRDLTPSHSGHKTDSGISPLFLLKKPVEKQKESRTKRHADFVGTSEFSTLPIMAILGATGGVIVMTFAIAIVIRKM